MYHILLLIVLVLIHNAQAQTSTIPVNSSNVTQTLSDVTQRLSNDTQQLSNNTQPLFNDTQQLSNVTQQLLNVTQQLSNVTQQLSDVTQKLLNATKQLSNDTQQLLNITQQISNVTQYLSNVNQQLLNVTQQLSNDTQQISNVTRQLSNISQQLFNVIQQLSNITQPLSNVTQQLSNITQQLSNVTQQLSNVTQQLSNDTQQLSNVTRPFSNNTQQLSNDIQQLSNVTQQLLNVTQQLSNVTQQLSNFTQKLLNVTEQFPNVTLQLLNITEQLSNVTQILSNVTEQLSNDTQQFSNVPEQLSNITQQLSNITQQLSNVTQQLSNVTQQLFNNTQQRFNVTQQLSNITRQFPNVARQLSYANKQLSNGTDIGISTNNGFLADDENEKSEDTLALFNISNETDVSNIHFHLIVPRYYSPYEEVPFLYFINSSITNYTNQEKHYFSLHMGSSPFSPTYGLLLSDLPTGSYTFHIGRAYNQTWVADAVNAVDNTSFTQTINVSDIYTTTSYEINVQVWSDLYGENFSQSTNSSSNRIFLLRAHYKSIDCDINRRIWMYLPPDYETATLKRYPVVYAHWGQLMFNYYGTADEWRLDHLLNDAFNSNSSCDILKWGLIVVAIDALPTKLLSNTEYIVSREDTGCHSQNLIRTFSGSFKRHIHTSFRTLNQWDYTTMLGYGTAGGLVFDLMTKYYQKFGKFIILSWILDEECCESEVEINDALATSRLFRSGIGSNKNSTRKTRLFPKIFFTWTLGEEPAEITRARDNAKGLKHRGMPISNIYVDPVNTSATAKFYGAQTIKAFCWLFNNQSAESYSDIAPWWDEEQVTEMTHQETTTTISQM